MTSANPYAAIASEYVRLLRSPPDVSPDQLSPPTAVEIPPNAPTVLLFSPHPDDECLVGALPLRLMRELKLNVLNVAVTLGSRKDRQQERWEELQRACNYLGFGLIPTQENGLERVNLATREGEPEVWAQSVSVIRKILQQHQPKIIFFPHDRDWNRTHIGTHYLVMDAIATMEARFSCWLLETEYWGAMDNPNLAIESSAAEIADLMAATSFHEQGFFNLYNPVVFSRSLYISLSRANFFSLDLFLDCSLERLLKVYHTFDVNPSYFFDLDFDLEIARNLELILGNFQLRRLNPELYIVLEELRDCFPNREDEEFKTLWQKNSKTWTEDLRGAMIQYRNIGHAAY